MTVFVLSFILVGLVLLAMAVGVIFGRKPISGSCGGMGALGIDTACDICGGNPQRCEESRQDGAAAVRQQQAQYYSADRRD